MIDIFGHFGSRLSYATISDQLARGLAERDALGSVANLDDVFVDPTLATPPRPRGKKAIVISDVRDYLTDSLVSAYGRENVALFVCPNTDTLSIDRRVSCQKVDRIYTPSAWCADTIHDALSTAPVANEADGADPLPLIIVEPLGVDDPFFADPPPTPSGAPLRLLHVTTDTFWPGRKGTEELLLAWTRTGISPRIARLTIHCLPQLHPRIYQEVGDLGLLDTVKIASSTPRGGTPEDLFALFREHDMLVAPSRSEGFGIMPLSALVSGMPVVTTGGTGQDFYLGQLAGWLQVPTMGMSELVGEEGFAPSLRVDQLAYALRAAVVDLHEKLAREARLNTDPSVRNLWSWTARRAEWVASLTEWE